jgi:hypothetical protein
MPESSRLPLVWAPLLRPLAALVGSRAGRCWVEVGPDRLTASFGALAYAEVPRSAIRFAVLRSWPWWYGFGVRWYGWAAVGFVGRGTGVVELTLDPPIQVRAVVPRRVRRLALSPGDPDRLLALLGGATGPGA